MTWTMEHPPGDVALPPQTLQVVAQAVLLAIYQQGALTEEAYSMALEQLICG